MSTTVANDTIVAEITINSLTFFLAEKSLE